jgi:hypothetical protein
VKITRAHKDYAAISFVILAAANERRGFSLNLICIENKEAIATDGWRLHRADLKTRFRKGFYRVCRINQNAIEIERINDKRLRFPNYERVFWNTLAPGVQEIHDVAELGSTINPVFLEPLASMGAITYHVRSGHDVILFFGEGFSGAIHMPMKKEGKYR